MTVSGKSKQIIDIARKLAAIIAEEFDINLEIAETPSNREFVICIGNSPPQLKSKYTGPESYSIKIDNGGITIRASHQKGLRWGIMTLRQLITRTANGKAYVHGVEIHDFPDYQWRGFMIDAARGPNNADEIKRIIRICSAFKLNFLIFREGDDELNAVRYHKNKLGSENPYALDIHTVAQLTEYANSYGITFIPEIESLGHSAAKRLHYPHLVHGGRKEYYGPSRFHMRKMHLQPSDPEVLRLLETIYDEWFDNGEYPFIHLGMDEVKLPKAQQAQHLAMVLDILFKSAAKHNRKVTPIIWSDAPVLKQKYEKRIIRCLWSYEEHNAQEGTPGLKNKFLQYQHILPLYKNAKSARVFMAGGSGSRHVPYSKGKYIDAIENLASWARLGKSRPHWQGLLAVQWGGNMLDKWLIDFLAAGDFAWKIPEKQRDIKREISKIRSHLKKIMGMTSHKPNSLHLDVWDGFVLRNGKFSKDLVSKPK